MQGKLPAAVLLLRPHLFVIFMQQQTCSSNKASLLFSAVSATEYRAGFLSFFTTFGKWAASATEATDVRITWSAGGSVNHGL